MQEGGFLNHKEAKIAPRIRIACYPSSTFGCTFINPYNLGRHGYVFGWSEKNGIVYTCKAGHIDIAHLRKSADWTAFLAAKTFDKLKKNKNEFTFKFKEPSKYFVKITYPDNWKDLSEAEREQIMYDVSLKLGQYFAYTGSVWHEILTWFGYRSVGFYPEFPSAFSWEDTYSNLLGVHLAVRALSDSEHTFNQALTIVIEQELEKLGLQSKETAIRAAELMRGPWFSGDFLFLVDIKGRNFDIGLEDGCITPWIVPSLEECEDAEPLAYPVPNLDFLSEYSFSIKIQIEPRELERNKILNTVYAGNTERKKRLDPLVHFPLIMDYIRKDAVKRHGYTTSNEHFGKEDIYKPAKGSHLNTR